MKSYLYRKHFLSVIYLVFTVRIKSQMTPDYLTCFGGLNLGKDVIKFRFYLFKTVKGLTSPSLNRAKGVDSSNIISRGKRVISYPSNFSRIVYFTSLHLFLIKLINT